MLGLLVAMALAALAHGLSGIGPASRPPPPSAVRSPSRSAAPALVRPGFLSGVVEGYYGPPWSAAETRSLLAFMAKQGFTTFVYAPKGDPDARAKWNQPYPASAFKRLRAIVLTARQDHITFIYSVSPGLNIVYSQARDRQALLHKVQQVAGLGVRHFMLSFDDVPPVLYSAADRAAYPEGVGQAQSVLANWLVAHMAGRGFRLLFTPTYYYGLGANPYWTALKTDLAPEVDVIWTGPQVLSPSISGADARAFSAAVGHPIVIWANYPVNDYTYAVHAPRLFLGPFRGLGPTLPGAVAGILANPMQQAAASEVALYTLASYLRAPSAYNPVAAFTKGVSLVGVGAPSAFRTLAEDASGSFLGGSLSPLPALMTTYERTPTAAYGHALAVMFEAMAGAPIELAIGLKSRALRTEVNPWAAELSREGQDGLQALTLLGTAGHHAAPAPGLTLARADALALEHPPVWLDTTTPVLSFLKWAMARAQS